MKRNQKISRRHDLHQRSTRGVGLETLESRRLMSTYYLAPTGSDSAAGTLAQPFATLNKALAVAKSGDVITLRGGTYAGGQAVTKPNITIQGYAGETAKIAASTSNASVYFALDLDTEASGTVLRNLDISGGYYYALKTETTRDYANTNGTYHAASNILIDNVKLHDSGTHVFKISPDSDHITIQNSEIYNSGRRDPSQGQGIDAVDIDDLVFNSNYIHDTTQNAIFVKGGSQRALIENNRIYNAGYSGILLGQDTDAGAFDTTQNPNMYEALNCKAINNTIVNAKYSGIGSYSATGTVIQGNTIRGASASGQAGIFFSVNGAGVAGNTATVSGNTVEVVAGRPLVSILSGALSDTPKFSNNDYYNSNNFSDDRSAFYGTLAKWQAKGLDAGSTYTAGAAPLSADFNGDGKVNIDDYTVIDLAYANPKGDYWVADATLDGKLNTDDYAVIDFAVDNQSAPGAAAAAVPSAAPLTMSGMVMSSLKVDDVYVADQSVLV
jgi:putative cofactor-binding repeat protein